MTAPLRAVLLLAYGLWLIVAPPPAGGQTPDPSLPDNEPPAAVDSTHLGVVWTPPDAPGPALREMRRIHAVGATAIRLTTVPSTDTIFARADSLNLRLYVDLPVSYTPASALRARLTAAQPALDRLQSLARQHPSVQAVGLAKNANTTVPAACSALRDWTTRLHNRPASLQTYYVTPFAPSADRCAEAVDHVLLDTRATPRPADWWAEWAGAASSVGLGALGTWTRPDAATGLQVPHSAERQARYLERILSRLLAPSQEKTPPAIFAYRWQDRPSPLLEIRQYGLHTRSGSRRPAATVVEGFYTGAQRVFAFSSGSPPPTAPHSLLLLGWGLLVVFAVLYAQSGFVKQTAARYFGAHGFYRDAVRNGRDIRPELNALLLLLVATALGIIGLLMARAAAAAPVTEHVIAALPSAMRGLLALGLTQPILAGGAVGGLTLFLLTVWMGSLVLGARRQASFSVAQGLMLVVWPCWPVLPGLIVALVTATHPPLSPALLWTLVLGGGLGTIAAVTIRVLRDYASVAGVPPAQVVALTLPSPLALLALTLLTLVLSYDPPLALLWALLTQT
jgi:hypothetical protein